MTSRRPAGVVLIVIYTMIVSSISLTSIASAFLAVALPPYALAYLLIPLVGYAICLGLWRLRTWGYWSAFLYFAIGLLAGVYFAAFGEMEVRYSFLGIAQWVIAAAVLVYLATPGVRGLFSEADDS